jgi:Flp pilus assembly protein TadD
LATDLASTSDVKVTVPRVNREQIPREKNTAEPRQRETARNVFVAGHANVAMAETSPRAPWVLPAIAVAIVVLGAALWFGWQQFSRLVPTKRPVVATAPGALSDAAPTTGQVEARAQTNTALPTLPAETIIPPLLPPPLVTPAPPASARAPGSAVGEPHSFSERELLIRSLKAAKPAREAPISLKLSPKIDAATVSPQMSEAYAALLRGDYADAKKRYTALAQSAPFNIDAHLGLAAAAARSGDLVLGQRAYQRALELDPRNQTAIAGLIAVTDGESPESLAVEIKKQISLNPDAAPLHFALGNAYASLRRWTEAQQAYFEAYRLDSNSADHLYNLAVSLDQLGQSRLALDYYEKSLALVTKTGAQFDRAAVTRRMSELRNQP